MSVDIQLLLEYLVERGGSDLMLKPDAKPGLRVDGKVYLLGDQPITGEFTRGLVDSMCSEHVRKRFTGDSEVDTSWEVSGLGRFRANIFLQRGQVSIVLRRITGTIGSFEDLNLPQEGLKKIAALKRGLVLVTGIAGSGKSTTLAALIEYINQTEQKHIVTIEDPIEYLFQDQKSMIQQREIGLDTRSFATALKHVVRQSPDVILIGEMRDHETVEAAISAAETGHLVFSTLHTVNAIQTVERIINFFPPHQHTVIRLQLSLVLQGVVSQRLMVRSDQERGRIPAVELMLSTPRVRELLEQGKTTELYQAIKEGHEHYGCQTFNQSLNEHLKASRIQVEEALAAADDPDELKLDIRGIRRGV
jgi:twitching motility protein PilT